MNPLLAVVRGKLGRYPNFETSLAKARLHTARVAGRVFQEFHASGGNVAENRNQAVDALLTSDCDCLVMVDDDQVLRSDVLIRLTERLAEGYAIVAPLILQPEAPFASVAWRVVDGERERVVPWGQRGILDVDEVGTGVIAIRREVFSALERPWFRLGQCGDPARQMEDVWFCRQARAAGFRIGLDLDHQVGHTAPFTVWPDLEHDCVVLSDQLGHRMALPAALFERGVPVAQPAAAGL